MEKIPHVNELREIYQEMNTEGKKKMAAAAIELLSVQKTLENTVIVSQEKRKRQFTLIPGLVITGPLLLLASYIFWITLINPALFNIDISTMIMVRIFATALFGMFCIGAGFLRFILQKLTISWLLFAIGAGILCVDPRLLTDLIGITFAILIISMQVIQRKQEKTAMTELFHL